VLRASQHAALIYERSFMSAPRGIRLRSLDKFLAVNFLGFRGLSSHSAPEATNLNKNEAELSKDEFTLENFYD
jgi:hypothetical protein